MSGAFLPPETCFVSVLLELISYGHLSSFLCLFLSVSSPLCPLFVPGLVQCFLGRVVEQVLRSEICAMADVMRPCLNASRRSFFGTRSYLLDTSEAYSLHDLYEIQFCPLLLSFCIPTRLRDCLSMCVHPHLQRRLISRSPSGWERRVV